MLSFVIPVLNEEESIAELLQHVAKRYPLSELIVVDGGSTDTTVSRAGPLCHHLLEGARGRALQMNLGASAAKGDYLVFLHSDTRPTFDGRYLERELHRAPGWGYCRVRLSGGRWIFRAIERAMNARSGLTRVATGDQMLFVRRDLFEIIGGFATIPLMEDVEICKRLRQLHPPHVITQPVVTSSRRWETRGVSLTIFQMWCLRLGYFLGVSPQTLWRQYYGQ